MGILLNSIQQTLKAHINRHITSFVAMTEASDHVSHQIPDDRTRVGYLIASIESANTNVVAALSSIRMDDTGRRENFETALVFLAQIFLMVSTVWLSHCCPNLCGRLGSSLLGYHWTNLR